MDFWGQMGLYSQRIQNTQCTYLNTQKSVVCHTLQNEATYDMAAPTTSHLHMLNIQSLVQCCHPLGL